MKNSKLGLIINIIIAIALSVGAVMLPSASWIIMAVSGVFFMVRAYMDKASVLAAELAASLIAYLTIHCRNAIGIDTVCAGISDFFMIPLSGAIIGCLAKAKSSYRMVISGGALACLASFLIEFAKFRFYYKMDLAEVFINQPLSELFSVYSQALMNTGAENASAIAQMLIDNKWYVQQALATVIPSVLIIMCAFIAFFVFIIGRKFIARRYGIIMETYPHFWQLQMPRSASFALTLMYILSMFMSSSPMAGAVMNIVIILSALYVVCGLAVVDFFFRKTRIHWIFRLVIYGIAFIVLSVLGAILPFANVFSMLLFAGVFDGMFDFRHLRFGGTRI